MFQRNFRASILYRCSWQATSSIAITKSTGKTNLMQYCRAPRSCHDVAGFNCISVAMSSSVLRERRLASLGGGPANRRHLGRRTSRLICLHNGTALQSTPSGAAVAVPGRSSVCVGCPPSLWVTAASTSADVSFDRPSTVSCDVRRDRGPRKSKTRVSYCSLQSVIHMVSGELSRHTRDMAQITNDSLHESLAFHLQRQLSHMKPKSALSHKFKKIS